MLSRRRFMNDRIASENGDNLVLQNVKGSKMNALTVYGNSTQDATPSPENPVPIVSAGDEGEINVSVSDGGTQSQTLTLSTPGGLPGIPVSSGGNYTDENGQQWICDEIDLKRGKYVQRVSKVVVDGVNVKFEDKNNSFWNLPNFTAPGITQAVGAPFSSNYFPEHIFGGNLAYDFIYAMDENINPYFSSDDELNAFCAEKYTDGQPLEIYYPMDPIETDLTAEEIATYQALHTYTPNTTVSNDTGAWVKVGYREWRR